MSKKKITGPKVIETFYRQKQNADLVNLNFHDAATLKKLNRHGLDHADAIEELKIHQRLLRVGVNSPTATRLRANGFHSAHHIAAVPEHKFIREYARLFNGDQEQARLTHQRAVQIKARLKHVWANVRDAVASHHYRATLFHNVAPSLLDYFQGMPSYQDLFGGLDYCECKHCNSIFSPAAYFLDIMRITDEEITHYNAGTIPDTLKLEGRRPDLFNLPLNCANTDTPVPYLQVVNQVLKSRIEADLRFQGSGKIKLDKKTVTGIGALFRKELSVGDQIEYQSDDGSPRLARIVTRIESDTKLEVDIDWSGPQQEALYTVIPLDGSFRKLATASYPFNLPFNLPLAQIRLYLAELNTALASVYSSFIVPQKELPGVKEIDVVREYLGLSTEEYRMITSPDFTVPGLSRDYGYDDITKHLPFQGTGVVQFKPGDRIVMRYQVPFKTGEVSVGDQIKVKGETRTVVNIEADYQHLMVDTAWEVDPGQAADFYMAPLDGLDRVKTFTARTGLNRDQLLDLFNQNLDEAELKRGKADHFFINNTGGTEVAPYLRVVEDKSDPSYPFERIEGLSLLSRLDRLNRFIRLAGKMGWSYAELDWSLVSIGATEIDKSAIKKIAQIKRLGESMRLPVEVLCSFWHDMKDIGRVSANNPQNLFDRVFNRPALLDGQDPYDASLPPVPFDPSRPMNWQISGDDGESATIRSRLLAALMVSDDDLTMVANYLLSLLDPLSQQEQKLSLNLRNLTWLYRLTKLSAQFQLSIDEYLRLLCLIYYPDEPYLTPPEKTVPSSIDSVLEIQQAAAWLKTSSFNVYELHYILTGELNPYVNTGYSQDAIGPFIESLSGLSEDLSVKPDSFVFEDTDADQSAKIFEDLKARGFISDRGILLDKEISYDTLAFFFLLIETSFETDDPDDDPSTQITEQESRKVFRELANKKIIIITDRGVFIDLGVGMLSATFTSATDLEFLFGCERHAALKREKVREILLQVKRNIDHAVVLMTDSQGAQEEAVYNGLAEFLSSTPEMMSALLPFAARAVGFPNYLEALLTPPAEVFQPLSNVPALVAVLSRWLMLADRLKLTADEARAAINNQEAFNIEDVACLRLADVRSLSAFKSLESDFEDRNGLLIEYLQMPCPLSYPCAGQEPDPKVEALSKLTGWDTKQIYTLVGLFWPKGTKDDYNTVTGLARLKQCFDLCVVTGTDVNFLLRLCALSEMVAEGTAQDGTASSITLAADASDLSDAYLGMQVEITEGSGTGQTRSISSYDRATKIAQVDVGWDTLPDKTSEYRVTGLSLADTKGEIINSNWTVYVELARATLSAVSAKYQDNGFDELYETISGQLEDMKRDALLGFTLWHMNKKDPAIESPSDLYQYLLIDVEMSGCTSTSYIAQGIASVQLYMQRCRMGLEPGVTELKIPEVWWQWMSNYRIWEANRKVFLYPENYIDPTLRTNQTPLFKSFVEELLQTNITDATVAQAYTSYFDEFAVLASLVQCASYNCKRPDPETGEEIETLFIFAHTKTEPFTYYFRMVNNRHGNKQPGSWTAWEKVDLVINAPYVTPVYAFDRLFIFWAELESVTDSDIKNSESNTRTTILGTIKYSFYNFSNQWVQPQVLAENIQVESPPTGRLALREELVKALYWLQPYVLSVQYGLPGTGRVTITDGGDSVTGSDTKFKRDVKAGDEIWCAGETMGVKGVADDTTLQVDKKWGAKYTNALYKVIPKDKPNQFPSFRGVGEIYCYWNSTNVYSASWDKADFDGQVTLGYKISCKNISRVVTAFGEGKSYLVCDKVWGIPINSGVDGYFIIPNVDGAERLVISYGSKTDSSSGHVKDFSTILINSDLLHQQPSVMITDYKYYSNDNPKPYKAILDRNNRLLRIVGSENLIASNYWGNSIPGMDDQGEASTPIADLLFNISDKYSSLLNVANQPGWFIFDNGDETFLAASQEDHLNKLMDLAMLCETTPADATEFKVKYFLSCGPYRNPHASYDYLPKFAFLRLSTNTIGRLSQMLFSGGLGKLLTLDAQRSPELPFNRFYSTPHSDPPVNIIPPPTDSLDFNGAYGLYFWEVFFHAPLLVGYQLSSNQRFDEARKWYQYIFNPTQQPDGTEGLPNDRFWRFLPFRNLIDESLVAILNDEAQIDAYNADPFDPDAIARLRLAAYPKATVLKYIDNLLGWGDYLFAQDTQEAITQATNLYVMAADLLGKRPDAVGECATHKTKTFNEIKKEYPKGIPQFLIDLENTIFALPQGNSANFTDVPFNDINSYFCVPDNEELIGYWDRVEDRLYKIRHCMNIQGVERQLAMFEPPINPRELIRAVASGGGSLASAPGSDPAVPNYRFAYVLDVAKGMTANVIQLGASLLSALEKRDAEELALISAAQEKALLNLTTLIKQNQVVQAAQSRASLVEGQNNAKARQEYYTGLSANGLSSGEEQAIEAMYASLVLNIIAGYFRWASVVGFALPQLGSPFAMTYGGQQIGSAMSANSSALELGAYIASFVGERSLMMAGYDRREAEWDHQATLAGYDFNQIAAQIAAADVQQEIARRELEIHQKSIRQNEDVEAFLKGKFTNKELYQWMANRLSAVYFQTYRLAVEVARLAQRAYQYELNSDNTFINFGYWDDLHKGLLAGEGLMLSLGQMEKAFVQENVRTLEIERVVSLMQIDPKALLELKTRGECMFELSEKLFDYDFPGHYCRKLKTISVSIPAVIGPYQNINATLTQLSNQVVIKPDKDAVSFLLGGGSSTTLDASALRSNWRANQQVALCRGTDDSGLFELNFQDERYLPFEGTGAVSTWRLSMPFATNRIDFSAVSDVIIRLSYTAFDGGKAFRSKVTSLPALKPYYGSRLLIFNQEYSQQWFTFLNDHSDSKLQTLNFDLTDKLVPPHIKDAKLTDFYFLLEVSQGTNTQGDNPYIEFQYTVNEKDNVKFLLNDSNSFSYEFPTPPEIKEVIGGRKISFDLNNTPKGLLEKDGKFLNPQVVQNLILILYYEGEVD
jgi:hypothetical protein